MLVKDMYQEVGLDMMPYIRYAHLWSNCYISSGILYFWSRSFGRLIHDWLQMQSLVSTFANETDKMWHEGTLLFNDMFDNLFF